MLKLNIWTPSLTGKRPVMFYIHGGGFSFGSSYELPSHEGAQMARHHDVVQVSVNHRLNILGFFDVSEIGGSAYEDSVNVGMTDLVAALKWVHGEHRELRRRSRPGDDLWPVGRRIEGDDADGHAFGCGLVPSRLGAVGRRRQHPHAKSSRREVARQVMKDLGLAPNDIASLQKMEWAKLVAAGNAAVAKINPPGPAMMGPGAPGNPRVGWSPCVDGKVINMRSFFDAAPEISKNVPMLIGSVSEEGNHMLSRPTEEEWHANLAKAYGDEKATAIVAALKKTYPQKSIQTLSYMCSGGFGIERPVHAQQRREDGEVEARAERRACLRVLLHVANADSRWIAGRVAYRRTSILLRQHQALRTGNRQYTRGAGTGEEDGLSAWAAFAATGNPSLPGMKWTPTDPDSNKTMVWDNECRMVDDPEESPQDHFRLNRLRGRDCRFCADTLRGRSWAGRRSRSV